MFRHIHIKLFVENSVAASSSSQKRDNSPNWTSESKALT